MCRSGHVGGRKEFIAGPMNLHELSRIREKAGNAQLIHERKADGEQALLPMFFELAQDIFNVVLINKKIPFHNSQREGAIKRRPEDLLLVIEEYLGVRYKE